MKRFAPLSYLLFLATLGFFHIGCKVDFQVGFKMNEQDVLSSDIRPSLSEDRITMLSVLPGDTILIRDVTEPRDKVTARSWTINGVENAGVKNTAIFPVSFQKAGYNKITLCINDFKPCASKWVYVQDVESSTPSPIVAFIKPNTSFVDLKKGKTIDIEVRAEHVSNKADLSVMLNDSPEKFSFDPESGLLKAKVGVKQKDSVIEIYANTPGGFESKRITVQSAAFEPTSTDPTPGRATPPPPPPSPPTVTIYKPEDTSTEQSSINIEVGTSGIFNKNQLSLKVNDKAVTNVRYSDSRKKWVAEHVRLYEGENEIEAIATNSAGSGRDSHRITVEKLAPPPPPVVSEIGSRIAWAGVNSSNISLSKCTDFSVSSHTINMKTKKRVRLMEAEVYSSGCGSLTIELSIGDKSFTETFELSTGKCTLVFYKLDNYELPPDLNCKLTMKTGTSSNCTDKAPLLLNAKSCGQNSGGDQNISLDYGGNVCLFKMKYQY